jgi:hypothetical protein
VRATGGQLTYFIGPPSGSGPNTLTTAQSTALTVYAGGNVFNGTIGGLAVNGVAAQTIYSQSPISLYEYPYPLGATPARDGNVNTTDSGTGGGAVVDPVSGDLFTAAVGANGGTHFGTSPLSNENHVPTSGTVLAGTQTYDKQMVAVGQWHGASAVFYNTTAGIEILGEASPYSSILTLALSNTALPANVQSGTVNAIAYGADGRLWLALSNSYVIAIPVY